MNETLHDLALRAKKRYGDASGRALAETARSEGHKIDRTQLNQIIKGTYDRRPHRSTIAAIAWLAGVDESRAYRAADLRVPEGPFIPHEDADYLTAEEKRAINGLIQVITAGRADARGDVTDPDFTVTDDDGTVTEIEVKKHQRPSKREQMQQLTGKAARPGKKGERPAEDPGDEPDPEGPEGGG